MVQSYIVVGQDKKDQWELDRQLFSDAENHYNSYWRNHHHDLTSHIKPSLGRYLTVDKDDGKKRMAKILNEHATYSYRTMREGFQNGKTPSTRPWFALQTDDPGLMDFKPARVWLTQTEEVLRSLYLKSNFYHQTPKMYENFGILGISTMSQLRDPVNVMRFQNYPIGSYFLGGGAKGQHLQFHRKYELTTQEILDWFGIKRERRDGTINTTPAI